MEGIGKEDLKMLLEAHHRKKSELAKFLGVSYGMVSHWLNDREIPRKHYDGIKQFFDESVKSVEELKSLTIQDSRTIYDIILQMTKDQKINVIQFILGTL
jgi:predicted transcriptional regulator